MTSATALMGQVTTTPYSRYGYGILSDHATSAQRAMGGVGYAMNSGRQINVMNPASYAAIDSLTFLFDMGVDVTFKNASENGTKENDCGGGLDYITMQFPITHYMGVSLGIVPYSSVGYSFGNSIDNGSDSRAGEGGLSEAYVGLGARLFKGFSIGANVSYMFGTISNDSYAVTTSSSTSLFEHVIEVRDYNLNFGAQYTFNLSRKNRLTLGAVYSPSKSLHGHAYGVSIYSPSSTSAVSDTTAYVSLKGNFSMPNTYGGGIAYEWNDRLLAEVDFTYQNWKDAKFATLDGWDKTELDNRWKTAVGLQYQHNPRGNYFQRMRLRAGGYYSHDYLVVKGNNVKEYGASVGFGLPVNGFKTLINLGFEWKHRQATPNPLIKENYFNITLGVNFNEMWFWHNKLR
jgi:long-subunit fatty acid transport protein